MEEAVRILDAIICQSPDECQNVINYITKIKCLLQLDKMDHVTELINQLEMILQSNRNLAQLKSKSEEILEGIQDLIEHFITLQCFKTSMQLAQCKFHVLKVFCEDNTEKLDRCERLGDLIERLVTETMKPSSRDLKGKQEKQSGKDKFDKPRVILESVLQEMLMLEDVPVDKKALKVGLVYKHFAFYLEEIKQYSRAVEMNKQGIAVMMTVFAGEGKKHKVLGYLHNGLGSCLSKLHLNPAAAVAYERAVECFNEAEDWEDQAKKYDVINTAMKNCTQIRGKPKTN